jgi:hypothetical protein
MSVTLHPAHPYLTGFSTTLLRLSGGGWRLKWRSFDTVRQDRDFATEAEALNFAATLPEKSTTLDEDCGPEAFRDADEFWREMRRTG